MIIGVPKEQRHYEFRVGMTPMGVSLLSNQGHMCYVEKGAGSGSGFSDADYERAGARIAYRSDEVFQRANLLLKVYRPTKEEVSWMAEGQTVMAFMMFASAYQDRMEVMQEKNITAIAYELIEDDAGLLPVQYPLSQIGGRMAVQIAAQYLQNDKGGAGMLLGGIAGVPAADVVIVGAGVVGLTAAQAFLNVGSRVILLDHDVHKLEQAHMRFEDRITTMVSYDFNLERVCKFCDVLVGAVQIPGQRAPQIITREMVQSMHSGALIIDMSIDQGGCVATSRPTEHDSPTFVAEGVTHYCVYNMPGVVGRTATHAFLNAAWPYIQIVAENGVVEALDLSNELKRGVVIRSGMTH